jgi:divalent metal cation (Fe/Co/Zn/Cd) transporter
MNQLDRRERTLLLAVLLSLWAPLATGLAVILSRSSTQVADFTRRSVELVALMVSWWVYRHLQRQPALKATARLGLERVANLSVALAMACSGGVVLALAVTRWQHFEPGGNVLPGLVIAVLGLITNTWFWRRYTRLAPETHSIIATQRRLYRAKALLDACVIMALSAVAFAPQQPLTSIVDLAGSLVVAAYLLWSAVGTARAALAQRGPA